MLSSNELARAKHIGLDYAIARVTASRSRLFGNILANGFIAAIEVGVAALWIIRFPGPWGYCMAALMEVCAILSGALIGRTVALRDQLRVELNAMKRARAGILEFDIEGLLR